MPAGESTPRSRHPHDAAGTSTSTVRTRSPARDAGSHGLKMLFSVQHHDDGSHGLEMLFSVQHHDPLRAVAAPNTLSGCIPHARARLRELLGLTSLKDTLRPEAPASSTVKVPALCPREEWRLHHSSSVVAGGSSDDARLKTNTSRCTVRNCTHLWDSLSNVQERPQTRSRCAGRRDRHSEEATLPSLLDPPRRSGGLQ